MDSHYQIIPINTDTSSIEKAMNLVWGVFLEFEAPEYSDEGIREFKNFITPQAVESRIANAELFIWGCFDGNKIVGVIATRPPCHISLLFVDKAYHRQGRGAVISARLLPVFCVWGIIGMLMRFRSIRCICIVLNFLNGLRRDKQYAYFGLRARFTSTYKS